MHFKIEKPGVFFPIILFLYFIALCSNIVTDNKLIVTNLFLIITIIIVPLLLFLEIRYKLSITIDYYVSFFQNETLNFSLSQRNRLDFLFKFIGRLLVAISFGLFLLFFIDYFSNDLVLIKIIEGNNPNIVSSFQEFILTTSAIFATLLALHWTIISAIFTKKYAHYGKEIQQLYLTFAQTKNLSCFSLIYIIVSIILYYYVVISTYTLNITLIFSLVCFSACMLTYAYIFSSLKNINISNPYYLYKLILTNSTYQTQLAISINKEKQYKNKSSIISHHFTYLNDIIMNEDINLNEKNKLELLQLNIKFLKDYLKYKKNIFYDSNWFPLYIRPNSLADTIYTSQNAMLAHDNMYIETNVFNINKSICNSLIMNKKFLTLSLYFDELRKALFTDKNENLISYDIPFFHETLNTLLTETDDFYQIILLERNNEEHRDNNNNIYFYQLITSINNILSAIANCCQIFTLKLNKQNINKIFPDYDTLEQTKTIQELCINYPAINNEQGLQEYIKLFIEKNTEGKIITPQNNFETNCRLPLIQSELLAFLKIFQRIYKTLQDRILYYGNKNDPHLFFNTFLTFFAIKYNFLNNIDMLQTIYNENNYKLVANFILCDFLETPDNILFSLAKTIKIYENDKYYNQKEYPILLDNIFQLLLHLLILYYNNEKFRSEKIKTITMSFHFMLTVHQILIDENTNQQLSRQNNNEERVSISYPLPFIHFACIIGVGIQKGKNNSDDIKTALYTILQTDETKEYFQEFIDTERKLKMYFQQCAQLIENQINAQNTIETFITFILPMLNENNNDR